MAVVNEYAAIARLDLAEVVRSRWLICVAAVYALLAGVFVLVGMRESTLMGFSGMGRVLLSFSHALVLLLPLLALMATGQVVNRAREDGTLELLFSHPVRRGSYFVSVSLVRYLVLVLPLVALMVAMALGGSVVNGQDIPWRFLWRALAVSAALLFAFVGLGMAVSTFVRSVARATIWVLLLWAAGVALLDFALIGLMLQWRLNPQAVFLLAAINPVESARLALLAGASSELSVLGPVGFFLAQRVGPNALFAVGTLWPLAVGVMAWMTALHNFRKADIV